MRNVMSNQNFIKWFGNSVVVDSDGNPLVLYHGTTHNFDVFNTKPDNREIGSHFGNRRQANQRLAEPGNGSYGTRGDNIKAVYLRIENPIRLTDQTFWVPEKLASTLQTQFNISIEPSGKGAMGSTYHTQDDIMTALKENGYDGIVYENDHEGNGDSYIVFDPNQIKSAMGNNGKFSSSNSIVESVREFVTKLTYHTPLHISLISAFNSIFESTDSNDLIIKAGTTLFHGTQMEFDINDVNVGGYDGFFWTTDNSSIAQTYIPVASATIHTSTDQIIKPQMDNALQKELGINYSDIKLDAQGRVTSWSSNTPEFKSIDMTSDKLYNLYVESKKEYDEYSNKVKAIYNEAMHDPDLLTDEDMDALSNHEDELYAKLKDIIAKKRAFSADEQKRKVINDKLLRFGYQPTNKPSDGNWEWKIKTDSKSPILPGDHRVSGRLLIVKPKRDMKIFDHSKDGEGDLTDLDYNKFDLFEKVHSLGYDGIKINDFAQTEQYGNYGHTSIGFFKEAVSDLAITELKNVKHPTTLSNESDEYKKSIST